MHEGEIVLTPAKRVAQLTGATDHATMTADETHVQCSTPATNAASPRLALTGEVVLRLPSVFIRTVGVPVESRMQTVPTIGVVGLRPGLALRARYLKRPQGESQVRTDDADATAHPETPAPPLRGYGGELYPALAIQVNP